MTDSDINDMINKIPLESEVNKNELRDLAKKFFHLEDKFFDKKNSLLMKYSNQQIELDEINNDKERINENNKLKEIYEKISDEKKVNFKLSLIKVLKDYYVDIDGDIINKNKEKVKLKEIINIYPEKYYFYDRQLSEKINFTYDYSTKTIKPLYQDKALEFLNQSKFEKFKKSKTFEHFYNICTLITYIKDYFLLGFYLNIYRTISYIINDLEYSIIYINNVPLIFEPADNIIDELQKMIDYFFNEIDNVMEKYSTHSEKEEEKYMNKGGSYKKTKRMKKTKKIYG